jgi:hypothetical protein
MKKVSVSSDDDLGSFEGKYPKDLFNKTIVVDGQAIGHIVRETDDQIVVFGDSDNSRFDIPKSSIALSGGSVILNEGESIAKFTKDRDAPLPAGKSLRPSAEEIRTASNRQLEDERKMKTTPDRIMNEASSLAMAPRPETVGVSTPEGYVDTESELSKKMKRAARELKEIIVAGTKVAKKGAKKAKEKAEAKQAAMDRQAIGRMGTLAGTFAESFEDILTEIRTRKYSDQVDIYTGFVKLLDQQRQLVLARRDLAIRLRDSVPVPVVKPGDMGERRLDSPPELPSPDDLEPPTSTSRNTKTSSSRVVKRGRAEPA